MNNEKFLPLGTICTVKGKNYNVMIIGYFAIEYTGNVKMFDYKGCSYPEGLLIENKSCSFNHSDIEDIIFLGYSADEHKKFNDILNRQNDTTENLQSKDVLSNIQFDEHGVVVYAPVVNEYSSNIPNDIQLQASVQDIKRSDIENPFRPTNIEVDTTVSAPADTEDWSIFKSIQFDENGVVISAVERTVETKEE
jgi:hypothetical protein